MIRGRLSGLGRATLAVAGACLLAVVSVGPVAADKPARGCPDDFERSSILGFRAFLSTDAFYESLPPEGKALAEANLLIINSDAWLAGATSFDRNRDGDLCLKQKPITKGNLYGWLFNAVDNTSNQ